MKANKSTSKLIEVIQDRSLGISSSEILHDAASWDQTALDDYVWEYLGQDTLLTKEELTLYEKLCKSGELDTLLKDDAAIDEVRALSDHEIQEAITQLQTSTAQIEAQSATLKIQQDAITSLVTLNSKQSRSRSDANGAQQRAWQAENESLRNEIDELGAGLQDFVNEIEVQSSMNEGALSTQASSLLGSDDKILTSLQKLSGALTATADGGEDSEKSERIKSLCAGLIKYTVEAVRCRLDRVFLLGLEGCLGSETSGQAESSAELDTLKGELESLYSEILPVAQMSAEQRYLQVALRSIAAQSGTGLERSKKVVVYILKCLTYLITRLSTFASQTSDYREHNATLTSLTSLLKSEITSLHALPPKPVSAQAPPSPTRRRASKSSFPQVRGTRPPMHHRRSSSLSFDDNTPPESQLLAALGIALPSSSDPGAALTETTLNTALQTSVCERMNKLDSQQVALQQGSEASVKEQLADAFVTVQLLRDSVLSESKTRRVVLVDEDVAAAISGLENEVSELRSDVAGVDLESLRERNQTREAFVERWSH